MDDIAQLDSRRSQPADDASAQREAFLAPEEAGYFALAWRRLRRDRAAMLGAALAALIVLAALLAPILAPHDPAEQFRDGLTPDGQPVPSTLLAHGTWRFPLGTDASGRDLLSRILYGAQVSLIVGVLANTLAVTLGTLIGSVAAFFGDPFETLLMRFTDVMMAFPTLLLAMTLVAILKPSLWIIILVIGAVYWTWIARVVYGQVVSLRERDFITAAEALGAGPARVIFHHLLPNVTFLIVLGVSSALGGIAGSEIVLTWFGVGVQPPAASFGAMLFEGSGPRTFQTHPHLLLVPGTVVTLLLFSFNLLGDALNDAMHGR